MIEDYRLRSQWDRRYTVADLRSPGTRAHTPAGNAQFYRAKRDALDRCMQLAQASLKGSRILDAAGGSGEFVKWYLRRGCSHVTIADYSEVAIMLVRQRWGDNPKVEAVVADMRVDSAELMRSPYDFVLVQESIFHLPEDDDLADAIQTLGRYVKPGGYMILSDVFPDSRQDPSPCVIRRPRLQFEKLLSSASFSVIGYVRQSVLFNRRVFGKLQIILEQIGPLYYWLDQVARGCGCTPPAHLDVKYLVAQKATG